MCIYKVNAITLRRIKNHLKQTKKKLLSNVASDKSGTNEKLSKENDKLIKLIEDNYNG